VLFDTNVLFAAFAVKGICAELLEETMHLFNVVWSPVLQHELVTALRKKGLLSPKVVGAITAFADLCEMHAPQPLPQRICRDPDDDVVLGVAVQARAGLIITGDDDLLVLGSYERTRILSPREFLELVHSK
jgi:putative PIN family toxin of toxin-antitoxin system